MTNEEMTAAIAAILPGLLGNLLQGQEDVPDSSALVKEIARLEERITELQKVNASLQEANQRLHEKNGELRANYEAVNNILKYKEYQENMDRNMRKGFSAVIDMYPYQYGTYTYGTCTNITTK
jgi:chromosome segregation ATPase